jgi:tetratricopeptide (TPR) repeat protein
MHRRPSIRILFFALLLISSAKANSLRLIVKEADLAIENQDWAAAEVLLARIVDSGRCRTHYQLSLYGPIYFNYGICKLKKKNWKDAARSFEKCYKKFPSRKGDINPYHILSLRYWAEAEYFLGNHEDSSKLFVKYFREKEPQK